MGLDVLEADWPAPDHVRSLVTTRTGGVSDGAWRSLNLGDRCGDQWHKVLENRRRLEAFLPGEPCWLNQVHGTTVAVLKEARNTEPPKADAAVTGQKRVVLSVLTADCLPVLLCETGGKQVGIAHAGWRGMAAGVIEKAVRAMGTPPSGMIAWLGPAIGKSAYEVGGDVWNEFARHYPKLTGQAFQACGSKWKLDLATAAREILLSVGIDRVYGGEFCTYSDPELFFSHRRDGVTGRMASCIWTE